MPRWYFPRVIRPDPRRGNELHAFAASGAIAGLIARSDGKHGVWKAPAGYDAAIADAQGLSVELTDCRTACCKRWA